MTNWLGQTLHHTAQIQARGVDITALLSHRCLRDRSDRRALESCCAVLSCSYDERTDWRPQAQRLLVHYRAWCRTLGFQPSPSDEQTAMEVMFLWVERCQRADN